MSQPFAGKVVLITGASGGIGRATALAFGREGAIVVATARREAEGEETARLIRAAEGKAVFIRADATDEADIKALVAKVVAQFGRIDVAFNNAGVEGHVAPFHTQQAADYDAIFAINVRGLFLCMKHEIEAMLGQGGGVIVNNSSIAGLIGFPGATLYCASKHAVNGLTKGAALEYAREGIRVNAVAPAAIQTDMIDRFAGSEEGKKAFAGMHPVGRLGRAEEVAAAVLFLARDTSSFVTGVVLPVDGGYTAQ